MLDQQLSSKSKDLLSPLGNNGSSQSGSNLARALEPSTINLQLLSALLCDSVLWYVFLPSSMVVFIVKAFTFARLLFEINHIIRDTSRHRLVPDVAQEHAILSTVIQMVGGQTLINGMSSS